ncbi:MAG: branched-chain amino acid aminotransferase [Myxococcales bacterium]|jgi:branched-chain amino acid aminotransferase|nr:branched-chain amino acid aminotransferase [Myxococcales bacterium]
MTPMPIDYRPTPLQERRTPPTDTHDLGFGRCFSDHFFQASFRRGEGWGKSGISALRALDLSPAALCLHYGQTIFEGLKAYRGRDGAIFLFRLGRSAERFARSAQRLTMEPVPTELFERAVKALVLSERKWIPECDGSALYIRPTLVATDPFLGVRPGDEFLFYVLSGPVGPYYPQGFNPVNILVETEDVRAVRGGLGEAKTGANYAHSLQAQQRAAKKGYAQVLWLDALERCFAEEVGTMNIFFLIDDELITPPLTGTILPGITRDSVLALTRSWGLHVSERPISIDEVVEASQTGKLQEIFGTGTAAVISPVGQLSYRGVEHVIHRGKSGPLALKLFEHISLLQRGELDDPFGWVQRVDTLDFDQLLAGG